MSVNGLFMVVGSAASAGLVALAITAAVMKSRAAKRRTKLIDDGEQHASDLKATIAVERDRSAHRATIDAVNDAADMVESAAAARVAMATSSPGVTEGGGFRGGKMPASKYDEGLGL